MHASHALLAEQANVLELIVRGSPLADVLAALCRTVERHAGPEVRAAIVLAGEPEPPATWWTMPIVSSTGATLGSFVAWFPDGREPRPPERALVEVAARTAALAIEHDRADRTVRAHARRQQFLAELGAATQVLAEPTEIMQTTARMLAEHLDVDRCAYAEIENERVFAITGDHVRGVPSIVGNWNVAAFGPACEAAMRAGEPYVVEDAEHDPRIGPAFLPAYRATTTRAGICVPLHKHGRFTAAMAVHQQSSRRWTADEIELVTLVVARSWEALERTRVTRDLRASEERYRTIVKATPEAVKLIARDGTLLQINPAGLEMLETTEEEAIGRNVYDVIAPEHRERFRRFNEQVCQGAGGVLELDVIGRSGTRRAVETIAVPLPAPDGFHQLAITRDVTARAEAAKRLDYAVRLSGVGFWYCDLPFAELRWDARVKEHFFLPAEARVTIEMFYERIHADDREQARRAIEEAIARHTPYDVVYRACDPATGAFKWLRALGGTTYAEDGTPCRFDGVTIDVTAQKREEERIGRIAEAAVAIHSTSTLDGVLQVVTEQTRMLIGAHQAITSLTTDDTSQAIYSVSLSNKYARYRDYDTPPTGAGIYAHVVRTNRPMRLTQAELEAHPAWRELSGEQARHPPLRGWLAVPFVARDGKNLGLVQLSDKYDGEFTAADEAVLVQLAQLASVAIENARLYDELREQDRRKDEFLATLAHELRNPLAPIRTGIQLLQSGIDPPQAPRLLAMMDRQLVHLVRMVDDLLDISRVTLGKVGLQRERVELRAVLDSALETTRPLVAARGHVLVLEVPNEPLPLDVDPTRLSQVFANLINNAAKYTAPGGRIVVAAEPNGDTLAVHITDSGVGIPADMLPRVFDMFTQVHRTVERSQGGLGVGLTLVRRLVEMHGGTVEATSAGIGKGSTFTVRLPLATTLRDAAAATGSQAGTHAEAGRRILVVDDNIDAAETLAMLLEMRGNQTRLAHTGTDALAIVPEFQPDLIFLDIGLPEMDGYEVAARLRADTSIPQPVLIALTGWGSEEDRRQAHAAGFDRHVVKPIDGAKLREVLASYHC